MNDIWQHALTSIRSGEHTVLLAVTDHCGSVPGKTGAMAVVSPRGLAGTIGGGAVEKELSEAAARVDERSRIVAYDHESPDNDSICSGSQHIAMLGLDAEDVPAIEAVISALEEDRSGTLSLSPDGLDFFVDELRPRDFTFSDDGWSFTEPLGKLDTLFIVGGGHVALAFSRVMATLPFRIVVLDDREDVPTMTDNRWASETRVIGYASVADHIPDGDGIWVTIMTHAHVADRRVLESLLHKPLAYLGMMGSKSKVAQIFAALERDGISRDLLDRVHSPIGVDIASHTPEEIAVSIAAEIISVRNSRPTA